MTKEDAEVIGDMLEELGILCPLLGCFDEGRKRAPWWVAIRWAFDEPKVREAIESAWHAFPEGPTRDVLDRFGLAPVHGPHAAKVTIMQWGKTSRKVESVRRGLTDPDDPKLSDLTNDAQTGGR